MSYIVNRPLLYTKLTAKGRELLAKGELDYSFYAFGDSEVNYQENPTYEKILKPKDFQPNIKSFVQKVDCDKLIPLVASNKKTLQCCITKDCDDIGMFSGDTLDEIIWNYTIPNVVYQGVVQQSELDGTHYIDLGHLNYEDGDFICFKFANSYTGNLNSNETVNPVQYLWYKLKKHPIFTVATLDRRLPFNSFMNPDVEVTYAIYSKNDLTLTGATEYNFDCQTLQFLDTDCNRQQVYLWNFNVVWSEDVIGTSGDTEGYEQYGSYNFIGEKEYFGYNLPCYETYTGNTTCSDVLLSQKDDHYKTIGIIHYTNQTENVFADKFELSNFELFLPSIMWHNRYFSTGVANELGMSFKAGTIEKTVENSEIKFFDLIENSDFIATGQTPTIVGRIFADHKVVVIHDAELLAALQYKSNRNWSLPSLKGRMINSVNGIGTGVVPKGKTMWLTYVLEADNGTRYTLPHQKFIKFVNTTTIDKDIEFQLENTTSLSYMRKFESPTYDGFGFYAHKFFVLFQLTELNERPSADNWLAVDYTNLYLTQLNGQSINPTALANGVAANGFTLEPSKVASSLPYLNNNLDLPNPTCPDILGFGDERFLTGTIRTKSLACKYKSIFELQVNSNDFITSDNPTWATSNNLQITEVGIYNYKQELVMITKFLRPIAINTNTITKVSIEYSF